VCAISVYTISLCTISLCTISVCTISLCTISLYTISVCTISLCTISVCTISSNIPKLYILPTLYLNVLCGSQNKQRILPYTAFSNWFL